MRIEVREKIQTKLCKIMRQEEENANKRTEEEHDGEADDEFMRELMAAADLEEEKDGHKNQEVVQNEEFDDEYEEGTEDEDDPESAD